MTNQINQDTINKALWTACDVFRGTISADTYKDFIRLCRIKEHTLTSMVIAM